MPEEHIKRLRQSLEDVAATGDTEADELLSHLGASAEERDENLLDRLNEAALRWQATHPELSRLIGRVADLLSAEGI